MKDFQRTSPEIGDREIEAELFSANKEPSSALLSSQVRQCMGRSRLQHWGDAGHIQDEGKGVQISDMFRTHSQDNFTIDEILKVKNFLSQLFNDTMLTVTLQGGLETSSRCFSKV